MSKKINMYDELINYTLCELLDINENIFKDKNNIIGVNIITKEIRILIHEIIKRKEEIKNV
jgi:hypothetical protein